MSKTTGAVEVYPSFVSSMAAMDTFMAPDSTASRLNPGSLADRPRTPNQVPPTALEADLPEE